MSRPHPHRRHPLQCSQDLSFLYSIPASPAHMDTLARNVGLKPGHCAKLRDTLSQEASVLTHSLLAIAVARSISIASRSVQCSEER